MYRQYIPLSLKVSVIYTLFSIESETICKYVLSNKYVLSKKSMQTFYQLR